MDIQKSDEKYYEGRNASFAGDFDKALLKLRLALKFNPNNVPAQYEFALVNHQLGNFITATIYYKLVYFSNTDLSEMGFSGLHRIKQGKGLYGEIEIDLSEDF